MSERVTIPESGFATPAPPLDKSEHQLRVEQLMRGFGQVVRDRPEIPTEDERLLRARLILEEALETVAALGMIVCSEVEEGHPICGIKDLDVTPGVCAPEEELSLVEIADGCGDLIVVATGTLSAAGIRDLELLEEIDHNNLEKLKGTKTDEFGKGLKPEGHQPPDIAGVLARQLAVSSVTVHQDGKTHESEAGVQ